MAKGKNNKKNNTSLDNKYNQIIRKLSERCFEVAISACIYRYSNDLVEEVFYYMKNIYYDIDKGVCEDYIDPMYFMELLNYVEDYLILANSGKKYISSENDFIRKKFIQKLKENNIKFELLIYTSKIGVLYENPNLYPDNFYVEVAKLITDAVYAYCQYITTYISKFKNNEILKFVYDGEHIDIKYSPIQNLLKEQIDLVNSTLNDNKLSEDKKVKFDKYISKITMQIHIAYSNFMTKDIDNDYYEEFKGHLNVEKLYLFPFFNEGKFVISNEELSKIPGNRLYATHSSGIRFEFLNKENNIDFIDMKENEKHINFNVHIINNGGLSVRWNDDEDIGSSVLNEKKEIKSRIFKISFVIYKDELKKTTNLDEKKNTVRCLGYLPANDDNSLFFFMQIRDILLGCIYLAYYNPLLLKKEIVLHNRIIDKKTGYTRNSGFRIAHLKKLPTGYHASDEALKNAKKDGFDSIPEGYTFVRASYINPEAKTDKKVIKVDI